MASLEGVKAFLVKPGPFGLPVYAYVVGGVALVGGIWYFKTRKGNIGMATVAPQTTYPTSSGDPKAPLPFPGAGSPRVPPSPAFDLPSSGSSVPLFQDQSNFYSPPPEVTPSLAGHTIFDTRQDLGSSTTPPYAAGPGVFPKLTPNPTYQVVPPTYIPPTYVPPTYTPPPLPPPIANIPIISPIIAKLLRMRP